MYVNVLQINRSSRIYRDYMGNVVEIGSHGYRGQEVLQSAKEPGKPGCNSVAS